MAVNICNETFASAARKRNHFSQGLRLDDFGSETPQELRDARRQVGDLPRISRSKTDARTQRPKPNFRLSIEAILNAALGERDQAFASLEKAYQAHDVQFQFLGVSPEWDPLRSDPRFQDLLRRVGLAPQCRALPQKVRKSHPR
jgi:hypothetical protein